MTTGMIGTTIAVFGSSPSVKSRDHDVTANMTSRKHHPSAASAESAATFHDASVSGVGAESTRDAVDGPMCNGTDSRKVKVACERLQDKINRTKLHIQHEQTANEKNVREYLDQTSAVSTSPSMAATAATSRIKTDFERKNQKSAHTIAHLHRKLDDYTRRLKAAQSNGQVGRGVASGTAGYRPAKSVLKDVGHGLKELFVRDSRSREASPAHSTYSGDAKHTKDVAHRSKSGSLDNILASSKTLPIPVNNSDSKSADGKDYNSGVKDLSDDDISHSSILTDSASGDNHISPVRYSRQRPSNGPPSQHNNGSIGGQHRGTDEQFGSGGSGPQNDEVLALLEELRENQETQQRLQTTFDSLKTQYDAESISFRQTLEEERERCDRLEEQLNDLGELHQNEVTNIKQELSSMQEKIEYQLDERTKDMQELLESCQTKISKIEMQQQHQQQLISMEDIENSNFRTILTKLINVLLAILAVILVLVSTIANIIGPFLINRFRIVMTTCLIACLVAVWDNWPVICDTINRLIFHRYKQSDISSTT